jgi:hypothetical protein
MIPICVCVTFNYISSQRQNVTLWPWIGIPHSYPIAFMIQKLHVGDLHVVDVVMPSHSYKCSTDIILLGYLPHEDIRHSFMHWIKILHSYFLKNLNILIGYQNFKFFNLTQISVSLAIWCLFINRISIDSNIKNSKNLLVNYVGC